MSFTDYIPRWRWPFGRTVVTPDATPAAAPATGEPRTGGQAAPFGGASSVFAPDLLAGMPSAPAGDYPVWRAIEADPACVMSLAAITAPIREAVPGYQSREGTPDERVKLVQSCIEPLWGEFLREALDALSMGWKPFEVPMGRRDGRTVIWDLKPLAHELTQVCELDGVRFLRNDAKREGGSYVDLSPANSFIVTVGGRNRDPYGRPWLEDAREAWWRKVQCYAALYKLNRKASGTQAKVFYPPAADEESNHTNENKGRALGQAWMEGGCVVLPNATGILDPDMAADYRNIKGFAGTTLWELLTEQFKDTGPQALSILAQIQAYNVDISRALKVPERTTQEGEHGTKAEAGVHGEIATTVSQLVYGDICQALSRGPIDSMLAQNFGESARGSVWVAPGKLRDIFAEGDWKLIDAVLRNAELFMAVVEQVDLDAVFTRRGIPKNDATLKLADAVKASRERREAAVEQVTEEPDEKPVNGNGRKMTELARGAAWLGRLVDDHE